MAFDDYELSVESGNAAELYEFSYQGGTFRYTSADNPITFDSHIYQVVAIQHTPPKEVADIAKASLTVTAPPDLEVSELFRAAPPDDVVGLVIRRLQIDDGTAEAFWLGRVLSVRWPPDQSELRCESIYTSMRMPGLRRIYSKNCPHVLYGARCRAAEADFIETITVSAVAGRTITSPDFATFEDGYFSGGKIRWESTPGFYVRRGIKIHDGDTITVTHPIPGLEPGVVLSALPGCNHSMLHCAEKFDNLLNYGGFPYMTERNPFGANSVF